MNSVMRSSTDAKSLPEVSLERKRTQIDAKDGSIARMRG